MIASSVFIMMMVTVNDCGDEGGGGCCDDNDDNDDDGQHQTQHPEQERKLCKMTTSTVDCHHQAMATGNDDTVVQVF